MDLARVAVAAAPAGQQPQRHEFSIPAGELADAVDRFGEQSGLQIVYEPATLLRGRRASAVNGLLSTAEALDRLLQGEPIRWDRVDAFTVVLRAPTLAQPGTPRVGTTDASLDDPVKLEPIVALGRDLEIALLPSDLSDSLFGFPKSVLETPRSITVLSDDLMARQGIGTALDVTKLVPNTYTASIFSVNGNVNVRSVPSDMYFRGVKRLENTQMFPSPLTAMSRVDIVRGPSSPLYGPGKAGGFTNTIPKSARADTGKYLERLAGRAMLTLGSFDAKEASAEAGGPLRLATHRGGYYVYADAQDSATAYDNVPFRQEILQSSFDVDVGEHLRVETGQMLQHWNGTELAGWNRLTQELVDHGAYTAGTPLLELDLDGDGLISTAEVDRFGALRAEFPAGTPAAAVAAALGPAWRIDPASVRTVKLRRGANAQSAEDRADARVGLGYFDAVLALANEGSIVSKSYYEQLNRYKWTRASGYGQDTRASVFEQKLLWQQPLALADGLRTDAGLSAMYRRYETRTLTGAKYNDIVNRPDLSLPPGERDRFAVPNLEPDLAPWNTGLESRYDIYGAGALLDLGYRRIALLLGARYDYVDLRSRIPDFVLTTPGLSARGHDDGLSWSASLSGEVAGLHPYATLSHQATLLHGIDGGIPVPMVANALNDTRLIEAGVKTSLLADRLFAALSRYEQSRLGYTADTAQVPATISQGWELEIRWVPTERLGLAAGGAWQDTRLAPARASSVMVNPAFFGLPPGDYFGGRLQAVLPGGAPYDARAGYPARTMNFNATWLVTRDFSFDFTMTYQSAIRAGRVGEVKLPSAVLAGCTLGYDTDRWSFRLNVNNLTDRWYFIPNSPDLAGEATAIPAPGRTFRSSIALRF